METQIDLVQNVNLCIVDEDLSYCNSLKHALELKFDNRIAITTFSKPEDFLRVLKRVEQKPEVVILDYTSNKKIDKENDNYTVDYIKEINPNTLIIIISSEKNSVNALKSLAHGGHDLIIKDQFAEEHIFTSIGKCLHPTKI